MAAVAAEFLYLHQLRDGNNMAAVEVYIYTELCDRKQNGGGGGIDFHRVKRRKQSGGRMVSIFPPSYATGNKMAAVVAGFVYFTELRNRKQDGGLV